jgi:nucleoside phosphorylase
MKNRADLHAFCAHLAKLKLDATSRALCIIWWLEKHEPGDTVAAGTVTRIMRDHSLGNLNSTKLSAQLSNSGMTIKTSGQFKIKADKRDSVQAWTATPEPTVGVPSQPPEIAVSTPSGGTDSDSDDDVFDIVILCAVHDPELRAVLDSFGGHGWKDYATKRYAHRYRATSFKTERGAELRVIAAAPTHMGLTSTSILATQSIIRFRPKLILMAGIAAGTEGDGRHYGDLLVVNPSIDYASGKIRLKDGVRVFEPDPNPISIKHGLFTFLRELGSRREFLDDIQDAWRADAPKQRISMHIGPVGAADQVIDDPSRIEEVKSHWRKLIGFEMETYALYQAAVEGPSPQPLFVAIKSVCDFASNKDDRWRKYAAFTSAEYCTRLLRRYWEDICGSTSL